MPLGMVLIPGCLIIQIVWAVNTFRFARVERRLGMWSAFLATIIIFVLVDGAILFVLLSAVSWDKAAE